MNRRLNKLSSAGCTAAIADNFHCTGRCRYVFGKNKDLISRYLGVISGGEKSKAEVQRFVADSDPELKEHIALFESAFPRYELVADDLIAFFESAFPRYEHIAEDIISEGDKVAVRSTFKGSHQGDLMGIPPTGKEVILPLTVIYQIGDGKIVEHWMVVDQLSLMQQLGVVPEPS